MLLHTVYTVEITAKGGPSLDLPLTISFDANTKASLVEQESSIQLLIDRKIDHARLELVTESGFYKQLSDGAREPIPTLRLVNDEAAEHILSQDFISALAFLIDRPITLSRPLFSDQLLPETDEDRELLKRFGTDRVYNRISFQESTRIYSPNGITVETITNLMPRRLGLRLYANAMNANIAIAKF